MARENLAKHTGEVRARNPSGETVTLLVFLDPETGFSFAVEESFVEHEYDDDAGMASPYGDGRIKLEC